MPVSLCEWRVRIGRFVHSVREYVIRERKEKLLIERIRRLKLLHKRLLDKKDKSEDKCDSNQNELSAKVDNAPNKSSIINNDTPTDSLKEDNCSRSESTFEDNTTQTESTTNHKSNGDDSAFPFFFTMLQSLFSLLFSLIFFVVDFSNLLESSKPLLNWGGESSLTGTCLRIIACSSLAYIVLSYIIKRNEDVQDNQVLIGDENAKVEYTIKANKTPTESINKEKHTATESTIKSIISQIESNIKENNTQTESAIEKNFTPTDSRIKEKNTPTKSTECNNIPTNATITESNTPSTTRGGPSESKQSETKTSKRKTIKEYNTTTALTMRENSALPESTAKYNIAPKECHIDTPSTMTDKPSKRKTSTKKTLKGKKTPTESIIKDNNTPNRSTIKDSNTPCTKRKISSRKPAKDKNIATASHIKGNTTTTGSTIKERSGPTESAIKYNSISTESTIKDKNTTPQSTIKHSNSVTKSTINKQLPKRKMSKRKTTKYKNTATKSKIKGNTITTESTNKDDNSVTESTVKKNNSTAKSVSKGSNSTTECTFKNSNAPTKSSVEENNSSSESTIKEENSPTESNIKVHNTTSERTLNCNDTTTESTIQDHNRSSESTIKDTKTSYEPTIKDYNTHIELNIKDITSTIKSTIKDKNPQTESPVKGNNLTSESAFQDMNTTNKSVIKENTSSRTPTEENNNQSMKVNIAQAEYTIRSGIQKGLSDGKHGMSSQIPSSLKGTTDDHVMQESTCLPEMILIKAGDVEQNPGPFDRSTTFQEQELLNLAYDVPPSKYTELCIALGVPYNQSQTILDRHLLDFTRSLNAVFFQWKDRQRDGTDCRNRVAEVLRAVSLGALGDKMSRGGYLPQEAAPTGGYLPQEAAPTGGYLPQEATPTASIANENNPLTTEQVARCGDDFKTFYRTQLFKIKTDPLDFNSVFEFERIYTDLVLLRNEQGTTKKIPLDYKELLKTRVNRELPKRLMVEGDGGAGKTTFCSKMAWDWTIGADDFQEFVWVLVIHLRDIERNQTVGDIARTFLSDSNSVQPHQIDEYILANPSKVFIILDGLDEYDGDLVKEKNDIAKIIRLEKFKECRVLVTTRPWKADQIKSSAMLMNKYAFIAVAGFDKRHISIYINKYFADDSQSSRDLVKLIEDNDVIQENMAPFPIYIAMLCILWRDSDSKKRELIRRLKTFSQLFQEIIISLKDHYVSKQVKNLDAETVTQYEQLDFCFSQIGEIALSGIMNKKLVFGKDDFSSCEEAMETCCKVGVLSQETRVVRRRDRHEKSTNPVRESVFFPHKLFQEYIAGMYLASLFESDHEQYKKAMTDVIKRAEEFRYLLYFTASQSKNVVIDVTNRLNNIISMNHFLVDIAFEAYDEDAAKMVGQQLFAEQKSLIINENMSAHTVSGYLFIMDKIQMETLILTGRSCGPTVSRDLADVICSSTALTALELSGAKFHDDFYGILESKGDTSKVERLSLTLMNISDAHTSCNLARLLNNLPRLKDLTLKDNCFGGRFYTELASGTCSVQVGGSGHSVRKLHLNHRCHNDILQHGFTVEMLFPKLEHLYFTSSQTVSPDIVGSFAHSGLRELSFATENIDDRPKEDEECHVPLVGDPSSLEQVFLNSFPLLTNLAFNNLVIGNNRCKIILSALKKHQYLKNLCVIHCYTDEEIDPIVSAINLEKRMKVYIQRDKVQKSLECMKMSSSLADALCHRTSIQELILTDETIFSNSWFSKENQRTVDSKVERLSMEFNNIPDASCNLARFLNNLPRLKDLTLKDNCFDGRFYTELASGACSVQVGASGQSVRRLHLNHRCHNDILQHGFTVEKLFPNLEHLHFTTLQTVSPNIVGSFAHFGLTELSFATENIHGKTKEDEECHVPLVGDPSSLEQVFLNSFPLLTNLSFNNLVIGNNRCKIILSSLKQHQHLENVCVIHCYTDEEIDPIVSAINLENRMKVNIQRNKVQRSLKCMKMSSGLADALCHRTSIQELILMNETTFPNAWFSEENQRTIDSKIEKVCLDCCSLNGNAPTASRGLAKFLCLLPCLIDLTIQNPAHQTRNQYFHDDFYHEIARLASSSKIEKVCIEGGSNLHMNDPTASRDLAKFLCLLPCLTDLAVKNFGSTYQHMYLHDDFYHELARLASSSKIKKVCIDKFTLYERNSGASSDLAKFLCLLPCLTDLTIKDSDFRDDFYHEIARLALSSKIKKVCIDNLSLYERNSGASSDLAKFLCLLPCLTDLTIKDSDFRDDFYHEIARLALSSKIEKVCLVSCDLRKNHPTASRDLAKFLCLLPCLTDLTIKDSDGGFQHIYFRDDFYHEIARLASSSKIENVCIDGCDLRRNDPTASRDLAKFLCLLPCLTHLTIKYADSESRYVYFYDDFYHELARRASSSKIEKVCLDCCTLHQNGPSASLDLAKFLCLLPCLTNLTIKDSGDQSGRPCLNDDFFHELARLALSSKNPFFTNNMTRTIWYNEHRLNRVGEQFLPVQSSQQHHSQTPQHHSQTPQHHPQTPHHHSQTPHHQSQTQQHHSQTPHHHPQTQQHHYQTPQHHPQTQQHYSQTPQHHPQTQQHYSQTPQHHSQTQQLHSLTPQHHSLTPQHHSQTQQHHSQTQQHHSQTQQHHSQTQQHHSQRPHHHSQTPQLHPQTHQHQSLTPQYHSLTPQHHSQTPQHHSQTPQHHSQTQQHHSQRPQHHSKTQQHHSQRPHHHSQTQQHHSQTPQHHSLTPHHQSQTQQHHSPTPHHHPQTQQHHSQTTHQHSQTQQHHSQTPQHHSQTQQHHSQTPHHHPQTRQHYSQRPHYHPQTPHHHPQTQQHHSQTPHHHPQTQQHHSQTPQHHPQQPQSMTEQQRYLSMAHSSYDDQRHIINPRQPTTHQNLHQQPCSPQAPPQIAKQSQLTNLSGSQQSEQSNQLARRWGEQRFHPYSRKPQHRPQQPQSMTEQLRVLFESTFIIR